MMSYNSYCYCCSTNDAQTQTLQEDVQEYVLKPINRVLFERNYHERVLYMKLKRNKVIKYVNCVELEVCRDIQFAFESIQKINPTVDRGEFIFVCFSNESLASFYYYFIEWELMFDLDNHKMSSEIEKLWQEHKEKNSTDEDNILRRKFIVEFDETFSINIDRMAYNYLYDQ